MAHKVIMVVHDPQQATMQGYVPETFMFDTNMWYEVGDMFFHAWKDRHPLLARTYGIDDLEILTISIVKLKEGDLTC